MIQIGFRQDGMNTEGHDTLFAIAENKEAAFRQIKTARPYAAHIDTCLEVNQVDGWAVVIREQAVPSENKLWFINLGGYNEGQFGEVHKCILVVAPDLAAAKVKAKKDPFFTEPGRVQNPAAAPHIDDKHLLDDGIDDVLCVSDSLGTIELNQQPLEENVLTIEYIVL